MRPISGTLFPGHVIYLKKTQYYPMILIRKATENDAKAIVEIGLEAVKEAHKESCSVEDMNEYLETHYNIDAISDELNDSKNEYHLISYKEHPVGFSKIIMNAPHSNIPMKNAAKLDRIYLLKEYYGLKLGYELLRFNIALAKNNRQAGIWLFTWIGNSRAVSFYKKAGFNNIGSHWFKVTDTHYNENHHMFLSCE
jgi:ribosomal protein S18 acetylase RimI-like enzyme